MSFLPGFISGSAQSSLDWFSSFSSCIQSRYFSPNCFYISSKPFIFLLSSCWLDCLKFLWHPFDFHPGLFHIHFTNVWELLCPSLLLSIDQVSLDPFWFGWENQVRGEFWELFSKQLLMKKNASHCFIEESQSSKKKLKRMPEEDWLDGWAGWIGHISGLCFKLLSPQTNDYTPKKFPTLKFTIALLFFPLKGTVRPQEPRITCGVTSEYSLLYSSLPIDRFSPD